MNRGRFFSLNLDESALNKGIALFNYRPVYHPEWDENSPKRYKYPIYLVIARDEMSFYMSYFDTSETQESNVSPTYRNCPILTLSVSAHAEIRENLSKTLVDVYSEVFPAKVEFTKRNYIDELFSPSLEETKMQAYSSLAVFDVPQFKVGEKLTEERSFNFVLRKLLLDFIFDMEHSEVFNNASHIDYVYSRLNSNFLFYAIRNKAEYYYQRRLAHEHITADDTQRVGTSLFLMDYYLQAEKRWIETIVDPRAMEVFHDASGWLKSDEKEMNAVYQSRLKHGSSKVKLDSLRSCDYLSLIKSLCDSSENESVRRDARIKKGNHIIVENARKALRWYLHRYNFAGILKIWYADKYHHFRILLCVISLFLILFLLAIESVPHHWNIHLYLPVCFGGLLIATRFLPFLLHPRSVARVGGVSIFLPRLIAAIITGWFTLVIGENIFKGFFDRIHSWEISTLLFVVTLAFVYYEIDNLNPYLSIGRKIRRAVTLIGMAFVYSISSGILIMNFFGAPYLERSGSIEGFYSQQIYIDNPKYQLTDPAAYIHRYFYEAIESYDANLYKEICETDWVIDYSAMESSAEKIAIIRKNLQLHKSYKPIYDKYNLSVIYGAIEQHISEEVQAIERMQHSYAHLRSYFDDCDIKLNYPAICYPVTLKFLAEFSSRKKSRCYELHHHMSYGTLIKLRFDNLRAYIREQKESGEPLKLTKEDLVDLRITFDSQALVVEDLSWIALLSSLGDNSLYRKTLAHLTPSTHDAKLEKGKMLDRSFLGTEIFRNMLFQFSIMAMFIGVFLQLIFADKPMTASLYDSQR